MQDRSHRMSMQAVLVLAALAVWAAAGAARGVSLTWSENSNNWDAANNYWNADTATYTDGGADDVLFGDVQSAGGSVAVQNVAGGGVTPLSTTVGGANNFTFTGSSILGGALSKSGAGRLVLSNAANSFSGIDLGAGAIQFANPNQVGVSGGTITFSGSSTLFYNLAGAPVALTNPIQVANGVTATLEVDHSGVGTWDVQGKISGGTGANPVRVKLVELVLGGGSFDDISVSNGSNDFVGTFEVGNRVEFRWNGNDGVFGAAANAIEVTGNGFMDLNGNTLARNVNAGGVRNGTVSGVVTGGLVPFNLTLTNTGNNISNVTLQQLGSLQVDHPGQLGGNAQVSYSSPGSSPGTLRITGTSGGTFTDRILVEANVAYLDVIDPAAVVNWTGAIQTRNSGPTPDHLTKRGDGTLGLANFGNVIATSPLRLTAQAGTLNINDSAMPSGAIDGVYVQAGATLGGTGEIKLASGTTVNQQSGSTAAPGASVGTLTITGGTLDIDGAFTYAWEIDNLGQDLIAADGIDFSGLTSAILEIDSSVIGTIRSISQGEQIPLFTYSSLSGFNENDWTVQLAPGSGFLHIDGAQVLDDLAGTIYLTGIATPVPEPGTLALLALGVGLLWRRRRAA